MSFQNPLLLYGLFALIIPVLIHFFNFRKTRKVYFSNTRFLQKVRETTATKKRLKHYLILASRLLFLFFLVMAFAQPFLPAENNPSAGKPVFVYLDNSWSMSNEVTDGVTAMDRGIDYVEELISQFPPTTRYRLLTNDFLPSSRTLKSKREIDEMITEVSYSGISRNVKEIVSRMENDMAENSGNIFWISDFQRSTRGEDVQLFDSLNQVNLVPLGFSNQSNIYIDSVFFENPLMITDERVRLHVLFSMIGDQGREVIAKVYIDGVQSGTANVGLNPNGMQEVVFDLSVDRSVPHEGLVSFEEFPVTFDNEFYFVINVPEVISVLEIKASDVTTPVELVYANRQLFDLVSQPASNLDYNRIRLSDLVVLSGLDRIDLTLVTALNDYLDNGGTVLIVPGSEPEIDNFRLLNNLSGLQSIDSAQMTSLLSPDYDNPFFENIFEERTERLEMPLSQPVWNVTGRQQSLLSHTDGSSFLSWRQGQGDVFVLSTPLDEDFGNFSRHALFVPVMYKVAVSGGRRQNELYRFINRNSFSWKQDTAALNAIYRLVRDEEEIIPQQRTTGNRVLFDVPRYTLTSGFYELYRDEERVGLVAFNADPEESDIRQSDPEEVRQTFQGDHIAVLETSGESAFAAEVNEKYIGKTLWREALMLALLFLLAEVLLIRFMP